MTDKKTKNQDLKSEFLEMWQMYQESKSQNTSSPTTFDVDRFVNTINYFYDHSLKNSQINRKYTEVEIQKFLENPEKFEAAIREASNYLYHFSQEYKNLIRYFSKMLTLDYILIPDSILIDNLDEKKSEKLIKSFYKNLQFIQDYNIKYKLRKVIDVLLKEDFWFGYEKTDGENFVWQKLPTNYCRLLGLDEYETYTFEFDFSYFNKMNVNIKNYPEEFQNKYKLYKSNGKKRWQQLDPKNAICFKLDESVVYGLPFFSAMFDELFRLEDIKEFQQDNDKHSNYKLLHQQIPMDEKNGKANSFLIDAGASGKFHNNVRSNVPKGIGVVTTPMKINGIVLKNNSNVEEDIVAKNERNLFTTAGVSQLIFSADKSGSIGLNKSIEMDSTMMFALLRQFEMFFRKRLRLNNSKKLRWKLILPDITYYNRENMIDKLLKVAQYGYSKFFVSTSLGLSQNDFIGLSKLENNQLSLIDNMIPLSSSHVQDGDPGKPKLDENQLDDKGLKTRDLEGNNNRGK